MLAGFPTFTVHEADGRYALSADGQTVTFYTQRSKERDLRQFRELLNRPDDQIPMIVAPYHEALRPLLSEFARFVWIAPAVFGKELPADDRLVADDAAVQAFINSIGANDRFVLHVLPQWQSFSAALMSASQEILTRAAIRLRTIRHFGRLWQINFRVNLPVLTTFSDVSGLAEAPDALVMAGPSLDKNLEELRSARNIWCADTAFPVLVHHGIRPAVVFALDAGFGSREHFVGLLQYLSANPTNLVADALCFPAVLRLPFARRFTYASSHPLVQNYATNTRSDLTELTNTEGNVGNLMLSACAALFPAQRPRVFGHDRGHRYHVTHARGTAYYRRSAVLRNRLNSMESYSFLLSRRYGPADSTRGHSW